MKKIGDEISARSRSNLSTIQEVLILTARTADTSLNSWRAVVQGYPGVL